MRHLHALFFIAVLAAASHAQAEKVFLVQLGSFPTAQDADKNWELLQKSNQEKLSGLTHQNSILSLPPSEAKVFRLQAGPFISREDAASVCNHLTQNGSDCFIVESAAFQPQESPQLSVTKTTKAKPAFILPAERPSTERGNIDAADTTKKIDAPVITFAGIAPQTEDYSPSLFDRLTESVFGEEIGKPVASLPAKKEASAKTAPRKKAIHAAQSDSAALPWINTSAPKPIQAKESVTKRDAAAVASVSSPSLSEKLPETLPFGRAGDPYKPIDAPSPVRKELLPPPTMQSINAEPTHVGLPEHKTPQNMIEAASAAPRRLTKEDRVSPTDGRVEVDEAIQVPLSDIPTPKTPVVAKAETTLPTAIATTEPVLSSRRALAAQLSPSRNLLQSSYWVQLSYFKNEQAALNHWQLLRKKMPRLSSQMRVRVTQPYVRHSFTGRVSLQIGPFLDNKDIITLCNYAAAEKIRCGMSKDTGISVAANQPRMRDDKGLLQTRGIAGIRPGTAEKYWVHLGTYRSRSEASRAWDKLRNSYTEFQLLLPSIGQPPLSSSTEEIYRLRTGPFHLLAGAELLCDQIKNRGGRCLVVKHSP